MAGNRDGGGEPLTPAERARRYRARRRGEDVPRAKPGRPPADPVRAAAEYLSRELLRLRPEDVDDQLLRVLEDVRFGVTRLRRAQFAVTIRGGARDVPSHTPVTAAPKNRDVPGSGVTEATGNRDGVRQVRRTIIEGEVVHRRPQSIQIATPDEPRQAAPYRRAAEAVAAEEARWRRDHGIVPVDLTSDEDTEDPAPMKHR